MPGSPSCLSDVAHGCFTEFFDGERGAQADGGERNLVERLRERREVWRHHSADQFVLTVLDDGLKLPFFDGLAPQRPFRNRHNFIEPQDLAWVHEAVGELIASGAVKEWGRARRELIDMGLEAADEPFFIMPIGALEKSSSTTSDRKLRLIHDCRAINEHLDLSAMGFKLEQLVDFAKCLRPGDRLISTDLSSAYHHVGIYPAHWKYLGFELSGAIYVFCVLPFGLSASAGTFADSARSQRTWCASPASPQPASSTSTTSASRLARMRREPMLSASLA